MVEEGFAIYRDGRGAARGDLWELDPTGATRRVLSGVSQMRMGLRRTSVNALVQGVPYRYSFPVPGVPLERFLPLGDEAAGNPSAIAPAAWAAALTGQAGLPAGASLADLGSLFGDYYLTAHDAQGVMYVTPSGVL